MTRVRAVFLAGMLVAVTTAAALAGCASPKKEAPLSGTVVIRMQDFAFTPSDLIVKNGTHLIFRNDGAVNHTATSAQAGWDTKTVAPRGVNGATANRLGVFTFACRFHEAGGMTGKIEVVA